jgi:hypothetical protein
MGYVGATRSASFPTDVNDVLTRFAEQLVSVAILPLDLKTLALTYRGLSPAAVRLWWLVELMWLDKVEFIPHQCSGNFREVCAKYLWLAHPRDLRTEQPTLCGGAPRSLTIEFH